MNIRLDQITPSPHPIRSSWDESAMNELAQNLRENGLMQPIKVRPVTGGYEIVYGHRRVEAARRAGFTEIEATIDSTDDTDAIQQAWIENEYREDMPPLDKARALKALMDARGWNTRDLERHGVIGSEQRASQLLALLNEPAEIQQMLTGNTDGNVDNRVVNITERHIRATRSILPDDSLRTAVLQKAAAESLSAAQTRQIAEAVAAAPSERARQVLIDVPLASVFHDPEFVQERARTFGAHDPIYRVPKSTLNEDWRNAPEVADWLRTLKDFTEAIESAQQSETLGKFAPEARGFIARRLRRISETLTEWANALEGEDHE